MTKIQTGVELGQVALLIAPTMLDQSGNVVSSAVVNAVPNVIDTTDFTQLLAGGYSASITVGDTVRLGRLD